MTIAWPWLILLAPLIWILPKSKKQQISGALDHPYLMSLGQHGEAGKSPKSMANILLQLAWIFLVVALARPQWIGEPIQNTIAGRSLFLSVDLSGSMLEQDMEWNGRAIERYQAVQAVVGNFVENRKNDFIGLVVFGSFAEIQSPLTPDTQAVSDILKDLRPGMAGDSTAIGDGLALAVKQLRHSDSEDKVIILLSDGENRTGNVTPQQATNIAKESGIKVYTIGFGGTNKTSVFGLFRSTNNEIDEQALQDIAEQTDGIYFRATSTQDLKQVFDTISKLETSERDDREIRLIIEYYWVPLLLSLLCLIAASVAPLILRGKVNDPA